MKKGFTLIELLVVVLIIGILAAIAVPQYQKTVERSRAAEAMLIVSTLAKAGKMWTLESGTDPQTATWDELNINYTVDSPQDLTTTGKDIGNYNCRFLDAEISCTRKTDVGYSIDAWNDGRITCTASSAQGEGICKAAGCAFSGNNGTSSVYICSAGSGIGPSIILPPPVLPKCPTPSCTMVCDPPPPCTCPPPPELCACPGGMCHQVCYYPEQPPGGCQN